MRDERQEFTRKTKGQALKRATHNGQPYCECCGMALNPRTGTFYDHIQPDGLGGEPTLENCQVLCRTCHELKTSTEDVPVMAKADRSFRKQFGLSVRKRKIQSRGFEKAPPQHTATRPIRKRFT
jgi:hypothetical protein